MTTLITRLLENADAASEASSALRANGFAEEAIGVIDGSQAEARAAMDDAGIDDDTAAAYASGIAGGNALVTVRAPFGRAGSAITTLKKFRPIDVGIDHEDTYIGYKTDPTYQTSVIKGGKKFLTGKGVTESGTYFSPFGTTLLSKTQRGKAKVDTSTISAKFGWKLIKQPKAKKTLLTNNPTPLSRLLGIKLVKKPRDGSKPLVDDPTPLSSALGWPTLTERV